MVKRVISFLLSVCLFIGLFPLNTFAASYKDGYIEVNSEIYPAKLNKNDIYLKAEDIAKITNYELIAGDFIFFQRDDDVTDVSMVNDGNAFVNGKTYDLDIIEIDGGYYLPLAEMLYFLHAQWAVDEDNLIVQPLPKNIIDFFVGDKYIELFNNRTTPADLLINGDSKLAYSVRATLAAIFNDFNIFDHVSWDIAASDEPKFTSPFVAEQYKEALLQLMVTDEGFLQYQDQQVIIKSVEESGYENIKTSWEELNLSMEVPAKIPETAEGLKDIFIQINNSYNSKSAAMFDALGDLSVLEDLPWSDFFNVIEKTGISDMAKVFDIYVETAKVWNRSETWAEDYVDQLSILTDFDDTGFNKHITNYIKEASRELIKEKENSILSSIVTACKESLDFIATKALDATPLGLLFNIPNFAVNIAKTNEEIRNSMDADELGYMVNSLIRAEYVALTETQRAMNKVNLSHNRTEENINHLRNSAMLALRCNLRNSAFIYYLNQKTNNTPNWEQTAEAEKLRNRIQQDYIYICQLEETESYDRLLIRDNIKDIFNVDSGKISGKELNNRGDFRQEFGKDIFHEGDMRWIEAYNRGMQHLSEFEFADSEAAFKEAIDIDNKKVEGYMSLAEAQFAQGKITDTKETIQLAIDNAGKNKALTTIQNGLDEYILYDLNGNKSYDMDVSFDYNGSRYVYKFNNNGKKEYIFEYDDDGELWFYTVYEYKSDGDIEREIVYDDNHVLYDYVVYEKHGETWYDSNDTILAIKKYEFDEFGNKTVYTYVDNELSNIIKYKGEYIERSEIYNTSGYTIITEFNNRGQVTYTEDMWPDGRSPRATKYEYDESGKLIKSIHYSNRIPDYEITYEYDENNCIVKEISKEGSDIRWITTYEYDKNFFVVDRNTQY